MHLLNKKENDLYNEKVKQEIKRLANLGYASRSIADQLGVSKSGVNYLLALESTEAVEPTKEPRVLVLDIETAAAVALTFGRFKINY